MQATIRYYPAVGGVEEYVKRLSEGLIKHGHSVYVYTSDLAQHTNRLVRLKYSNRIINGVDVIRKFTLPIKIKHYAIMPAMPLCVLKRNFDLIHGHCFMSFPMDVAVVVSKIKGIPFILNPYFTELGNHSLLGRLYRKSLGNLAMRADVVIVLSEFERILIENAGYTTKRMEIIPPGIDINEFNAVENNIYSRLGIKDKKIVLFVGRIDRNKGVDVLIKAAKVVLNKHPDTIFFIAGSDFGELSNLKKMSEEYCINNNFIFSGMLNRQDLISAFKNADIFAFPSRYEAFGITLIEAMAARIPVVASNCSAIPFVVKHNKTGILFPPDNWEALADILSYLLKDNKKRKEIADNGYNEVINKYSWENTISKINDIYNSLLAG